MKLNGKTKKIVIPATAGTAAVAIVIGLLFGLRGGGEPVGVYPFSMVGMTQFWGDNQESYGPVTTDRIQTVFLSDTQTITEVKVQIGDTVKKGDVLMNYDTTLSELQLQRKRLDVERAKLQVQQAQEELIKINQMVPVTIVEIPVPDPQPEPTQVPTQEPDIDFGEELEAAYIINPQELETDGSSPEKALVCWMKDTTSMSSALLRELYNFADGTGTGLVSSSGSAEPTEDLLEEETTEPTETEESTEDPTETEEVTEEPTEEPTVEPTKEPTLSPFELFALRAPSELRIYSDVDDGDIVQVMQGSGVTLTFSSSITDWEHSDFVSWSLECDKSLEDDIGPLSGSNNGRLSYTVSGTAKEVGEYRYTVKALYQVDELGTLTASRSFTLKVIPQETASRKFYAVLMVTKDNLEKAPCTVWQGLEVTAYNGAGFDIVFSNEVPGRDYFFPAEQETPDISEETQEVVIPEQPDIAPNSGLTAAEIAKLRMEQEKKIRDLSAAAIMVESEYRLMEREFADGCIRATLDGEVVSLLTEEEARAGKLPMMKVSGGGGFFVQGSVSELERDKLKVGQEVTVSDWNTGMTYTGQVESIGDFPNQSDGWNGMGNPTASYYPFRVFIDGSADLQEGSYVSVTYSSAEAQDGVYLENPFLRSENGESYVYVRGRDGKLEKRVVTTGKSLWGSYTEICSGLTAEDYVAFPYGKTVRPGANTEEGSLSALYGY